MERVGEYRKYAAECVVLAKQATEPTDKDKLLAMARAWSRLAELAEKHRLQKSGNNMKR